MTNSKTKKFNSRKERGNPENRNAGQMSRAEERLQHAEEVKKLHGTIKKQAKESVEDKATIKQQAQDLCEMKEKYGDACRDRDIHKYRADIYKMNYQEAMDTLKQKGPAVALYAKDVKMNDQDAEAPQPHKVENTIVSSINEELFHFIHPSKNDVEAWVIHLEVKRLVTCHGIQEICLYLYQMAKDGKILLPQSVNVAYNELVRMGMPCKDGFNERTFQKYYKR